MGADEDISLVVLPGMDGTGELLGPLTDRLSLGRRVLLVSYPADARLSYDDLTAFVSERTPQGPFVILGESFSGPIAIEIAASKTEVTGLILASSFARHPVPSQLAALVPMLGLRWLPGRLIEAALLGRTGTPELKERVRQILKRLPPAVIQKRLRDVLQVDKRSRLRQVSCPVLYLHGRRDRLVGKRCVDEILSALPRSEVRYFDAPHMLLETHASVAAEVINEFVGRLV